MASRFKAAEGDCCGCHLCGPTEVYEKTGYRLNLCNHFPVEFMGSFKHFWVILNKILKMRKLFLFLKYWSHQVFYKTRYSLGKNLSVTSKEPMSVQFQSDPPFSPHLFFCSQHGDDRNAHLEGSKQDFRHQ